MGRRGRMVMIGAGVGAIAIATATLGGCIHRSGGAWMVKSAPLPEGWPEISPVGEVVVREYPTYRAASVTDEVVDGDGMEPMFMTLFRHIKEHDIAMTTPVDLGYEEGENGDARLTRMAFLYRTPELGDLGRDGGVVIEDAPAQTFASVGVRGGYSEASFERGLSALDAWFDEQQDWSRSGPPRFLGYNGPFVPWFAKYGEVQVPVERR